MAEVITNTSPLQCLHQLGRLSLLPQLFGRVTVTHAVVLEICAGQERGVSLPDLSSLDWMDFRDPLDETKLRFDWDLGRGELATLALAVESREATVILDDGLGRRSAAALNVPVLGTVGVLLKAKQAGLVPDLSPELIRLDQLGFRLKPQTAGIILRLAGEG